jgi:peptidyl-dipeptidase A
MKFPNAAFVALLAIPLGPIASRAQVKPSPGNAQAQVLAEEVSKFVRKLNDELKPAMVRAQTADWIKSTYITDDTEQNAAALNSELMAYMATARKQSLRFAGQKLAPEASRMFYLLRTASLPPPAPDDPAKRMELASIVAKLEGIYGKGKWCGSDGKGPCRDLEVLTDLMAKSRNYAELLEAWTGWRTISRPMRPLYARFVELSNEGAQAIGFANTGELWKSGYDIGPAEFEKETDRLWAQVKPLYNELHCFVRARLSATYGRDIVPVDGPIPAHLLGNMWAQEWNNIYPLIEPYKNEVSLDISAALKREKYDEKRMVRVGESFFTSLGFDPLPSTFWERSMFTKPRDREVVCHASAWDVTYNDDLRIKMCIRIREEDLVTIHHELGHDYYFHAYHQLPVLYQNGANDGFHEAIGDALTLSITPEYLRKIGLLSAIPRSQWALINFQLKRALEKVAFLPFGKMIDQWRWDVFAGKITPANYNAAWWELRRRFQGVSAPVARSEEDFDPGAKYHIPANVPYTRYFLARILQFQFHRGLCRASGHQGPLHQCSIYGNKEAGRRLWAMLQLGASKPWPEALFALTGERQMDASAILEYFEPLRAWLKEQNAGQKCGW